AHIAILDASGLIVAVNRAWVRFAEENGGVAGKVGPGADYLAVCRRAAGVTQEAGQVERGIREVLAGARDSFYMQYPCHSPTEQHWFQVRVTRCETSDGVRIVVAHENLTEQKHAEAEARRYQAEMAHLLRLGMMNEMAAGLAHELNQPLAAIANFASGSLRYIKSGKTDPEMLEQALRDIARQAERAGEIVRSIRRFVRTSEGHRQAGEINRVIEEAVELHGSDGSELGKIPVHLELGPGLPAVLMDEVQVQQVLMNLIRNASEAMASGPVDASITIRSGRTDPEMVLVEVSDNGPGVSDEAIGRLFDPFFTTKDTGLGLGLSLSRSIIDAHGGELLVRRNADRGMTFVFTLPSIHGVKE
ncbi:MAG: hypothetical protein EA380_10395, partial [Phycisphaeraceae bacterium]